ncbi:succinate dehydrogenase [Streptomyces cyaneofuscatus]|uniref:succinate dehydrogenase n=1 Tax=Streptomyces cyaneofuscatus TaxID=66883 RepID=UPI003813C4D8
MTKTRSPIRSNVGLKAVMAVTGILLALFLIAHMLGNLKVFTGETSFDHYAHWLRDIGKPLLPGVWFLWILRTVLVVAVVAHIVAATVLAMRARAARPVRYAHRKKVNGSYAARTMRWGGVIILLFVIYHILDLTTGTVHSGGFQEGHPYQNVVDTFSTWYGNVIYIVAMLALGLHIRHGFWSAAQTLGAGGRTRERFLKGAANVLALLLTAGFIAVPVGVMTGVVS